VGCTRPVRSSLARLEQATSLPRALPGWPRRPGTPLASTRLGGFRLSRVSARRAALVVSLGLGVAVLASGCGTGGHSAKTTTESTTIAGVSRPLLGIQDDALLASAEPNAWPDTRGLHPALIRYNLSWAAVAAHQPADSTDPGDAAYDFSTLDRIARLASAAGAQLLITIVQSPAWANGGHTPNAAPTDPNEFARFCTAVAKRYSGSYTPAGAASPLPQADRYTVWNEPNRRQYFIPQGPHGSLAPQLYARLYDDCAPAIRQQNPHAVVALGPLASRGEHGLSPLAFLAAYQQAGGPPPQAIALNPYMNGLAPEYLPDEHLPGGAITIRNLDQLEQAATTFVGKPVPIWLTEFAWRTAPTPHMGTITPDQQAQLLQQTVMLIHDHEPYVPLLVWFLVRDESPTSYWRSGLVTFDWQRKPAYTTFAQLARGAN
jgi:hypothetical protein